MGATPVELAKWTKSAALYCSLICQVFRGLLLFLFVFCSFKESNILALSIHVLNTHNLKTNKPTNKHKRLFTSSSLHSLSMSGCDWGFGDCIGDQGKDKIQSTFLVQPLCPSVCFPSSTFSVYLLLSLSTRTYLALTSLHFLSTMGWEIWTLGAKTLFHQRLFKGAILRSPTHIHAFSDI